MREGGREGRREGGGGGVWGRGFGKGAGCGLDGERERGADWMEKGSRVRIGWRWRRRDDCGSLDKETCASMVGWRLGVNCKGGRRVG